ncbi:hypothetical protein [Pseudonocardia sp. GCM10023141]|uniref:hypothetical protein n=1 Tax=Pseudonocardia sp. GCM10023141 TaxID=3252653 RepID=UPI0036096B39
MHLSTGGWVEGHRRSSTGSNERVLLLDPVTVHHPDGGARPPRAVDGFVPACDTERIEVLTAPGAAPAPRFNRCPRATGVR